MTEQLDSPTILIVDDHAPAAAMVSQIFSMRGYNAITVDNGEEAIKVAGTVIPDIILLDVMMPGMDGYAVLDQLRRTEQTADIPIILVTAKDGIDDIEHGLGLGADDYIPKPVKPREMLARVRSKIEANRLRGVLKKRTTELEAMLRFGQELNNQHDVASLLDLILFLVLDLVPCDASLIYHLDENRNVLDYREQRRATGRQAEIDPEAVYGNLLNSDSIILWSNNEIGGTGFSSGISVPLAYGDQLHGLLLVMADQVFGEHESRLFETIARQTTLALRNAEIYEHLEEMVEKRTAELRSAEELLIRSEKLASVGRLAAGIAHEINNPLMPIRMNLEMMQEDIQNNVSVTERDIEETLHSVNRISRIVERLQQFTRGRGEDIPEMEPLNLANVIESVVSLSGTFIRHAGVKLKTKLDPDVVIYGNRDQLEQVILNITLNAQAAMENGGDLIIEVDKAGKDGIIRIIDTGHGIPEDKREKIFEPFFSTKETGSGLGLFISHNIVHNHSGQIAVDSEVGKGTTFIITLPALKEETT